MVHMIRISVYGTDTRTKPNYPQCSPREVRRQATCLPYIGRFQLGGPITRLSNACRYFRPWQNPNRRAFIPNGSSYLHKLWIHILSQRHYLGIARPLRYAGRLGWLVPRHKNRKTNFASPLPVDLSLLSTEQRFMCIG